MRREVAGPEHTGDHALCVTVCNVEGECLAGGKSTI